MIYGSIKRKPIALGAPALLSSTAIYALVYSFGYREQVAAAALAKHAAAPSVGGRSVGVLGECLLVVTGFYRLGHGRLKSTTVYYHAW